LFVISKGCRLTNTALIVGETKSVYSRIMVDLGDFFTVFDKDGEAP